MHDSTTVQDKFSFTLTKTREIRDGLVGVIYSPGFGACWYTWNHGENCEQLIFDPQLVNLIVTGAQTDLILNRAAELVPGGCFLAVNDLEVQWFPQGTKFVIDEYDGSESIRTIEDMVWLQA
jgi:hypothetical protein